MDFDIAVIGGGFCGTLVAANILRRAGRPLSLAVIERDPPIGRGPAYATGDPAHLLNVPAGNMSAYPDEPDHFLRWARGLAGGADAGVLASSFVPRRIYAEYLNAVFSEAASRTGMHFQIFEDEAVSLSVDSARASIVLKSGLVVGAARAVLAFGNPPPGFPGGAEGVLGGSGRYVANPWSPQALDGVAPDDDVLLIGSGLTTADFVAALRRRAHRGLIRVVSRHGALPLAHAATRPYPPFLSAGPWKVAALLRRLREEVREAEERGRDWRDVLDSLRPAIPRLWRSFDAKEKGRFLRHARHHWDLHRHRVPPEIAAALQELRDSGRMIVHAARVESLRGGASFIEARIRERVTGDVKTIQVARAINCTGPSALNRTQAPLLIDLLRQGLVRADRFGIGLDAEPDGALLNRNGSPSKVLSTLGPTLKGVLWESTAVPELRVQARDLALRLLGEGGFASGAEKPAALEP